MQSTPRFDPRSVAPVDLSSLSEDHFRRVVNADLRRDINPDVVSQEVSDALRSAEFVQRWRRALLVILRSVEGQLAARATDFENQAATAGGGAIREIRSNYLKWRGSTERFKCAVEEQLVEAESICEIKRDELYSSVLTHERDRYARRVHGLEQAIRNHQAAVLADLEDGETPDDIDRVLWDSLEALDG